MNKSYYVYILSSNTQTLYVWVTSDLAKRIYEHKSKLIEWFTKKYSIDTLMYFEEYSDIYEALKREKQIKKWKREYKINTINTFNPSWEDLYGKIIL